MLDLCIGFRTLNRYLWVWIWIFEPPRISIIVKHSCHFLHNSHISVTDSCSNVRHPPSLGKCVKKIVWHQILICINHWENNYNKVRRPTKYLGSLHRKKNKAIHFWPKSFYFWIPQKCELMLNSFCGRRNDGSLNYPKQKLFMSKIIDLNKVSESLFSVHPIQILKKKIFWSKPAAAF